MQRNKQAFTLIELLVVVLIIGILAAVAIPQYQFAVDKSRVMPYVQRVQEIIRAEQVHFLHEGEYTGDLTALDIDPSKICPQMTGALGTNELMNCPGGIGINVGANYGILSGTVFLLYCQGESCFSGASGQHMSLSFSLMDGSVQSCSGYTARGEKLCAFFRDLYQ